MTPLCNKVQRSPIELYIIEMGDDMKIDMDDKIFIQQLISDKGQLTQEGSLEWTTSLSAAIILRTPSSSPFIQRVKVKISDIYRI